MIPKFIKFKSNELLYIVKYILFDCQEKHFRIKILHSLHYDHEAS